MGRASPPAQHLTCHGDNVLAAADRGRAGAGGRVMTVKEGNLTWTRYTTPNTVSLHVLTVLSCCASYRLLFVTYAMIARQGRSRYCLSIRLGQNGPQTLRRASYHGKSACASMLRHTPARDDGGEPPCRVSLPC